MKDIFISYECDSKHDVEKIVELLRSVDGYQICFDDYIMKSGDIFDGERKKGIDNCRLFVAFITKKYCVSLNCREEIKYAFDHKKKSVYVKLEENLGEDKAGIEYIVTNDIRLNGFDYVKDISWPVNLYNELRGAINKHLNNEISPQLVDLESLITCRICKRRFNLEDTKIESCRKPMQTNCDVRKIHENVLCFKCLKDKEGKNSVGNEVFSCPFDGNEHLVASCTDTKRLHNIIRYFEVKECFNNLNDDVSYYHNSRNITTNKLAYEVSESKRKTKEFVEEIIGELHNYEAGMSKQLDDQVEEWRDKQEKIRESLNLDASVQKLKDSLSEQDTHLNRIETAVKRNDSDTIVEHVDENRKKITLLNETVTTLNSEVSQETKKLIDGTCLVFKKGQKISDFNQVVGKLETNKIHQNLLEKRSSEVENQSKENEEKCLNKKIERLFLDVPDILDLCSQTKDSYLKVKELIEQKNANVNFKDKDGYTGLIWASRNGHLEMVKLLLQNGANINEKTNYGSTALSLASREGHLEIIKLLVLNGANVDEKNNDGYSALALAQNFSRTDVYNYLKSIGAK